jgi:hypothetical protein
MSASHQRENKDFPNSLSAAASNRDDVEKEFAMNHPNRDRNQAAGRFGTQQKQSGDQHLLPEDEPLQDPHRPHRVSREDMQKLRPADPDPDDPAQP